MALRLTAAIVSLIAFGACSNAHQSHAQATPLPGNLGHGAAIYQAQCAACHGRNGIGGPIGPSLHNEKLRRNYGAVRAIVLDPEPPMPKLFPSVLTQADVRDVSAYVETL